MKTYFKPIIEISELQNQMPLALSMDEIPVRDSGWSNGGDAPILRRREREWSNGWDE